MYFTISCILVAVEVFILIRLLKRYTLKSAVSLTYIIIFFYGAAPVLDGLIFGMESLSIPDSRITIILESITFLYVQLLYFSLLLVFGLFALFNKKIQSLQGIKYQNDLKLKHEKILIGLIICFSILFLYFLLSTFGLNRVDKKEVYSAFYYTWALLIGQYFWAFLYLTKIYKGFFMKIFTIVTVLLTIFLFNRQPLVFMGLVLLFGSKFNPKYALVVLLAIVGYLVLGYWKLFYILFIAGHGWDTFMAYASQRRVYLSTMDPSASYALIYDYLSSKSIGYDQYYFSYATNTFKQFLNVFFDAFPDYKTMGEFAKETYTGDKYGLAFSMILESLLNFWYFGPLVVGFLLCGILQNLVSYIKRYGRIFEVFFIISILVLIRTELAVFLKVNFIPMIIAFILFKRIIYKPKKRT